MTAEHLRELAEAAKVDDSREWFTPAQLEEEFFTRGEAHLIAACDPSTILALLDDYADATKSIWRHACTIRDLEVARDQLRQEVERLTEKLSEYVGNVRDKEAAERQADKLVEAVDGLLYGTSDPGRVAARAQKALAAYRSKEAS